MSYVIPDSGLNWVADRAYPGSDETLEAIAIGTGNSFPESNDTGLDNRVYIQTDEKSNVSFNRSSNTGQINAWISFAGGTEVDPGTEITEIAVFTTNDRLVYREVREPVKVDEGERVTLDFSFVIIR